MGRTPVPVVQAAATTGNPICHGTIVSIEVDGPALSDKLGRHNSLWVVTIRPDNEPSGEAPARVMRFSMHSPSMNGFRRVGERIEIYEDDRRGVWAIPYAALARPIGGESPVRKVLATEIGARVQIIGRLGHPLGTFVTLRGTWRFPKEWAKDMAASFTVSSVDGKLLREPVEFVAPEFFHPVMRHVQEIPEDVERGEEFWEVRGYETGEFLGTPEAVLRDVPKDRKGPIRQEAPPHAFGFYTRFLYSSYGLAK
jgi:hypothetical protein